MIHKKLLCLAALVACTLQTECGSAATQLANIDPNNGGSISAAGSYYLGWDIESDITIAASDVILDLNGHTINGVITINQNLNNITVMNGIADRIQINAGTNNISVTKMTFSVSDSIDALSATSIFLHDNICMGTCFLNGCANVTISASHFSTSSASGLTLEACTNVFVDECTSVSNFVGFIITNGSSDITIGNCISLSNRTNGFEISGGSINVLIENCIADDNDNGFYCIDTGSAFHLHQCIAQNSRTDGFAFDGNGKVVIDECTAFNNTQFGFNNSTLGTVARAFSNYAYNNTIENYKPLLTSFLEVSPISTSMDVVAQFWRNVTAINF